MRFKLIGVGFFCQKSIKLTIIWLIFVDFYQQNFGDI